MTQAIKECSPMGDALSFSQFACGNSIFFDSQDTNEVLLKGTLDLDDIYQFPRTQLKGVSTTHDTSLNKYLASVNYIGNITHSSFHLY